jgi:hypothetical protein
MVNEQTRRIINDLRLVREAAHITYQEIANRTEANGEPVSLSTIKKVFSDSYSHDHSYEHTIKPIARALEPADKINNDVDYQLLAARLELKGIIIAQQKDIIADLKARLDRKETRHKEREALYLEQIAFYKDQICFKDAEIKRSHLNIDRKDAMLRSLLTDDDKE